MAVAPNVLDGASFVMEYTVDATGEKEKLCCTHCNATNITKDIPIDEYFIIAYILYVIYVLW